jgi:thiol-disulfide isomerase/thioredoxin
MREIGLGSFMILALLSGCHAGAHAYPAGPYGDAPGEVVPPDLSWVGYRGLAPRASRISVTEFFDADGSGDVDALLVDQSAAWCSPCQRTAAGLHQDMSDLRARGVRVLMLVTEGADHTPATIETAKIWRDRFGGEGVDVAADPSYSFRDTAGARQAPLPFRVLVDPRTMTITDVDVGATDDFSYAVVLAKKNQK